MSKFEAGYDQSLLILSYYNSHSVCLCVSPQCISYQMPGPIIVKFSAVARWAGGPSLGRIWLGLGCRSIK